MALLRNQPRGQNVLRTVAEMADWRRKRPGRGLGLAFTDYLNGTFVAGIAEVSVNRTSGKVDVHKFWAAVDAGIPIQPQHIEAQIESAVIFGLGSTLKERVTLENGEVQQSNFHDYEVMRMLDVPEIHVRVISTDNPPTGIGEIGVPETACAVCNAIAATTGKRMRHLPFTSERVLAALKA